MRVGGDYHGLCEDCNEDDYMAVKAVQLKDHSIYKNYRKQLKEVKLGDIIMTDIKSLAELKIALLEQASQPMNAYERTNEELVIMEIDKIKSQKKLVQVNKEIVDYINSPPPAPD